MEKKIKTVCFSKTPEQYTEYSRRGIEKQITAGNMTEEDAELINEFVASVNIESNISASRVYKLTNGLSNVSRFLPTSFKEAKITDVYTAVNLIKTAEKVMGDNHTNPGKLSKDTQKDYVKFLKRFLLWLVDEGYSDLSKDKLNKIRPPAASKMSITAADLISDDDVKKLIEACTGSTRTRDQALISMLYEGAFRIHEIATMTWNQISLEDLRFIKINTAGKTGIPRYIPLTASRDYLIQWKAIYPGEPTGNNPVFVTNLNKSFSYPYLKKHIADITVRAGVKAFHPHIMRHSRITSMARSGYPEGVIKKIAWGSQESNMYANYSHLVGGDIDKIVAKHSGFDIDEVEPEPGFVNRICLTCNHLNGPTAAFCNVCGSPLSKQSMAAKNDAMTDIEAFIRQMTDTEKLMFLAKITEHKQ